jgi:dTDP-4-amino-4,6-dideoxygalactose transaminase
MIPVSKPYLPSRRKLNKYIKRIYKNCYLTNNGPLLQLLEKRLAEYLGVKNIICVANGSLALQLAYKALELKGEVVTTPFSFVATTSTLVWEGLAPVFADIDSETFNISPIQIEKNITSTTSAILPVHVYGNPCDVLQIEKIAQKHNLKVIYDAAHAFGVQKDGQSVLNYGDISTLSFHATKLFHTIEGGAVITNDDKLADTVRKLINFGFDKGVSTMAGINAKMNEFEAAMGLAVLDDIDKINRKRKELYDLYHDGLGGLVGFQKNSENTIQNNSYIPVLFEDENQLLTVHQKLKDVGVFSRRYFYPSLNTLEYVNQSLCETARNISLRILCLPLYPDLTVKTVKQVIHVIKGSVQ